MFCGQTKEFLSRKGVQFTERNIAQEPEALNELRRLGYMTTPVTVVDGNVIVGFDEGKLSQALGLD
jgi:glutaredoxin-like protein NrdH